MQVAPGRSSTAATGIWPCAVDASGSAAAAKTAGCDSSTRSISSGKMLTPFMIIMSSLRPCTTRSPSASIETRSPGTNQPSRNARAVAAGSST